MPRSARRVSFVLEEEVTVGERVPLLARADADESITKGIEGEGGGGGNGGGAFSRHHHHEEEEEEDSVVVLEQLPALLVRSCTVFTAAGCCSLLIGTVKNGLVNSLSTVWCMIPAVLACVWFVFELTRSLLRVRRVMLREEAQRKLSVRRMRLQLRRRSARASLQRQREEEAAERDMDVSAAAAVAATAAGKAAAGRLDAAGGGSKTGSSARVRRGPALVGAPSSRTRRHSSRGETPPDGTAPAADVRLGAGRNEVEEVNEAEGWRSSSGSGIVRRGGVGNGGDGGDGDGGGGLDEEDRLRLSPTQRTLALGLPPVGTASPDAYTSEERKRYHEPRAAAGATPCKTSSYDDGDNEDDIEAASTAARPSPPTAGLKWPQAPPATTSGGGEGKGDGHRSAQRAVRVSVLLQAWLRLWLTMAAFGVTLSVFMILLSLRLLGVSAHYLPAFWIASPGLLALTLLALHSLVILDGSGGYGGAPVLQVGGNRLVVVLGRRPIILLTLLAAVLVVLKIDSFAGGSGVVMEAMEMVHWGYALLPLWVIVCMLEAVYVGALWENYTRRSLTFPGLFGGVRDLRGLGGLGYWFCCCLGGRGGYAGDGGKGGGCHWQWRRTWWSGEKNGDDDFEDPLVKDYDEYEGKQQQQQVAGGGTSGKFGGAGRESPPTDAQAYASYSSPVRQRVELTPSQRAAAITISVGTILLTACLVSLISGSTDEKANWGVPLTMIAATTGFGMVGAGVRKLALAHDRRMRGPLPPFTKPLPVFFSDQHGGWIAGPPDPPVVSIFLLGDVRLRQEG
ncbi:unnamed protein product [Ectocarpus sp. CCAP 1310/34]|nr:unnamed protein product [Ectocarpus sp. CCAP 1310/34]